MECCESRDESLSWNLSGMKQGEAIRVDGHKRAEGTCPRRDRKEQESSSEESSPEESSSNAGEDTAKVMVRLMQNSKCAGRTKGSTSSVDWSISAAAQRGDKSRGTY